MALPLTLVLLPGLDGTEVFFRPLLRALPPWIHPHVVCFPATAPADYPRLLSVVSKALKGISQYHVLGWSFSGPLALMLAAAQPESVQGVILVSTFLRPPRPQYVRLRFAAVTPMIWAIRAGRRLPLWLTQRSGCELWRDKCETWRRVNTRMVAGRIRAVLAVDAREQLRTCPRPVLCLAGRHDRVVPYRNVQDIVRTRPSIRVHMMEGNHFALYTNPTSAAQVIGGFMNVHHPSPPDQQEEGAL
ncbi:hypothetical protein YTPLAS18_10700 [Nitrospira sp.]|nr:hypothetical protein YTPLAS18_10700 [Nitrospira sp.]